MLNNLLYGKQRSEFKKLLEETVIPEVMSYEEREPLLKPLLEYVHSITPAKLFRYRDCSETQFDAFYNDRIYAGNTGQPQTQGHATNRSDCLKPKSET